MTYRSKVAVVYLLGFFLDLINMFIASVAFPAMAHAFHATPSALAWVSNGYIAGLTLVIPFSSVLTRRIGPKRVILLSLFLFSAASAAAGLSATLESLIAWRVLQGVGGGLLIPVGQALTWQQFKPHERARLSSAVMLVALLAPACSPALGGVLVQTLSWRWIFFATLPVAIVTFVLGCLWLKHEQPAMKAVQMDRHDAILLDMAKDISGYDCVVLAQASMAHLDQKIEEICKIPVLSSPGLCMEQVKETLKTI